MSRTLEYYIVDAFADRPFGGNTAGVVLTDADGFPDERLMQLIAAELRFSETAFVSSCGQSRYHLRYFTPTDEVDLCGHATIATFGLLHSLRCESGHCLCLTKAGSLHVVAAPEVMVQMAKPHILKTITQPDIDALYSAIGLPNHRSELPIQVVYSGLSDIMLPTPNVATLNALHPDMSAICSLSLQHDVVSLHAFALSDDGHTAHVRNFAPACGIPEESATGTSNAALTHYLLANQLIDNTSDCSFVQGEAMGRPSVVKTHVDTDGTVSVGGSAVVVARGQLLV